MKRPLVTVTLAASILAVYGLELAGDGRALCARFGFTPAHPSLVTAATSLLLHEPSSLLHVGGNLVFLIVFGVIVEREIGGPRFLALFLAGGLAGAAMHVVVDPGSLSPLVGCSGSLFAVLAVAAALYGPGMLAFVAVLVATNVAHAFGAPGDAVVSFGCHLGGFASGVALVVLTRLRGVDLHRAVAA
jgi:membrane associated rhomboid family serine protease